MRGGGLFGDHLLSQDGSLLFVSNVDAVVAYATSTGEQVARLQHAARVTAVSLHPCDSLLLFSGSSDGRITLWDLSTGAPVRLWHVGSPIESLAVSQAGDTAYISSHWRLRQAGRLFAYDLGSSVAKTASGRAKVSQARRLVVRPCCLRVLTCRCSLAV
jgi:WD40 repeat protein